MKIAPKSKKALPVVPIEEVAREYVALRTQSKTIKSRMDELSAVLKDYAEKSGTKSDTGSYYVENDEFIIGKQAKKSVSFITEKALDFLKSKGLAKTCIKTIEQIDEDGVEKSISEGKISYEELESITTTKVTYAVDIKEKSEMPEVEQTEVKSAASRKPQRKVKS